MNAMIGSFVPVLGWALIDFLWQGALVGLAAAIALMALRNARPQTRYAVTCAALALCLALPMAGVWRGLHVDAATGHALTVNIADSVTVASNQIEPASPTTWRSTLQNQLSWVVALWSLGAGLLALRMSLGMAWVRRIGRPHAGAIDSTWQARLDRLAIAFGMQRDVGLRVVRSVLDSPVAAGIWRPMVLVPAALIARMPTDLLEALLAHELAHIKRHDYLVNLIQNAIEALLFYHPVVWWLSRQIRIEREQIADDLAAQALGEPRRLALALQELDQFHLDGFTDFRFIPAANGGNLMSRIQRLIRINPAKPDQHGLSLKIALPIIGLAAACLTVYAHGNTPVATAAVATAATSATLVAASATSVATTGSTPVAQARTGTHASTRVIHSSDHREDSYAVVRAGQDGINMSGDSRDIPEIERTKQKVRGDFIWVRRDGKAYIVQDPAVIARVEEAWGPAEALGKRMDALGEKMDAPSKQMEALGKQMEALSGENTPASAAMGKTSAQMEALGRQQEALGTKMEALGDKMEHEDTQQRDVLERQMQALQTQMEPLAQQMDKLSAVMDEHGKEMEAAQKPMEDLSRQMEEASKPMEELGKQMEALGKQEEQLSHEADRMVRAQIDSAIQSGKAVSSD